MKAAEDDGYADRDHGKENQRDQVAGKDVGPETNGERQQPGEVADQLNGEHQSRQQDSRDKRHAFHGRSKKMQQIFRSGMFEALSVVIEKGADRTTQRHNRNACWRFEARDQPNQVTDQDEDENDGEKRRVGFTVMADDLAALAQDESFNGFEGVLQASGRFNREAGPYQKEER